MVHLFLVKSWITVLVARAVMRHRGVATEDAVFLAVRGFDFEDPGSKVVRLPYGPGVREPFPKLGRGEALNFLQTLPRLYRFDRFVTRATGGRPFHYYSTNTRQRYNRVLTTHPACEGYSFLESGLISYRTREAIESIYPSRVEKRRDRTYYRERIGPKAYYADGYEHVYGVGSLAFPGFDRRIELSHVFGAGDLAPSAVDLASIEVVLVFDGLSAHRMISTASVAHATRRLFDHFRANGITRVHYKFHPAQIHAGEDRELERELERAAKDIAVTRLPESLVLEELAFAKPEVHFFVNVSSTALYAAQAGCRVTSYAPYVAEFEAGFDATIAELPTSWKQAVTFLAD